MNFGERLKQRRKEVEISVEDLAKYIGKNRATIYRYEKGDIENIPIDLLNPLAEALQTTPQYLMGWEQSTNRSTKHGITFGDAIRRLRMANRMNLEETSEELGITTNELQMYESGVVQIPVDVIASVTELFNVTFSEIVGVHIRKGINEDMAQVSINEKMAKQYEEWYKAVGPVTFTKEEHDRLIDFAKFLLYSRNKGENNNEIN